MTKLYLVFKHNLLRNSYCCLATYRCLFSARKYIYNLYAKTFSISCLECDNDNHYFIKEISINEEN